MRSRAYGKYWEGKVTTPKKDVGTSQESSVEVVMNAIARGNASTLAPRNMFKP
jgi:hypothetical protein